MTSVLVLGGVRSGKSRYAERLLADSAHVTYVAPGRPPDGSDPEWDERVRTHQERRPSHWLTVESLDLAGAICQAPGAVLVDCLGTWLARQLDVSSAWGNPDRAASLLTDATADLIYAIRAARGHVVLVSNEAGWGVVPEYASGRLFRDELGRLNAAVAGACDRVALVVAGRVLDLTHSPATADAPPLPSSPASTGPVPRA